jgi:predicted RNA-binding Zn ribbon-like protein
MDPRTAKGWRKAEGIITTWLSGTTRSMRQALDDFDKWAARKPVTLTIVREDITKEFTVGTELNVGVLMKGDPERAALWFLCEGFFKNEKRRRLKRCPQCGIWFVDKTRPGVMARCSASCTNKWWTLGRRREAGHRLPGTRAAQRRAAEKEG